MKTIEKRLDHIWARIVKMGAGHRCERCGAADVPWNALEAHHVFGRRLKSVRWDLANGVALCRQCHAHQRDAPAESLEWAEAHMGAREFQKLQSRAQTVVKRTDDDLKMLLESLE